ncbi:MAG: complex I NDUFA9 subunit family protein [Burkholderiales bacterium]|nr:complex I NDUFA9 subunit family protein [Burkholderiales bacterium]
MDLNLRSVCVFGGSGFVGSHIVHLLAAQGITVRVPTRYADTGKDLLVLPTVQVVEADIHERSTLQALVAGCDAVINLVGILHERGVPGGFLRVHAELPQKIVAACRSAGVGRFVHMSALNADVNGPSAYLRSKGQGEAAVKEAGNALAWTIFRPSVIFGRGDSFLNLFAQFLGVVPAVALASPDTRFQPIWVEDVGRSFVECLLNDETVGKSYDLCGPKVYALRDLVKYVGEITGNRRPVIGLSDRLSYLQAAVMEWLPGPLLTRDNYYSMKQDSVCGGPFPAVFGFEPTAIEAVVPRYLGHQDPRARYNDFRVRAGR